MSKWNLVYCHSHWVVPHNIFVFVGITLKGIYIYIYIYIYISYLYDIEGTVGTQCYLLLCTKGREVMHFKCSKFYKISWFILNPSAIRLYVSGAGVFISAWFEMLWMPFMHNKDLLKRRV